MKKIELIATTTFGLEAVAKRELINLGFDIIKVEDGKITFSSTIEGIAIANLWVRTADRIFLKIGEFEALTFDELFEQTKALDWTDWLTEDAKFTVNGKSVKSKLFSISDSQAIVKKAVVEKMKTKYDREMFEEDGPEYTILVSILRDVATLSIDTSGIGLHKRGYRKETVEAPIKETLAAALVLLSFWHENRVLYDPFCGSGTIPIEAAMIGRNIAPGLNRSFASQDWPQVPRSIWDKEIARAKKEIDPNHLKIYASDISKKNLEAAKVNAEAASVLEDITFTKSDFRDIEYPNNYEVIITNPPYGERLGNRQDFEIKQIYRNFGNLASQLDTVSKYIITSFEGFENLFEKKADRVRVLYNGKIKARYYQYQGPRPPKK